MNRKKIKLVISDIDGTILNSNHQIDSDLRRQVSELKKEGIPFVLASARSPKGIIPLAQQLGITDDPIASYNGALIMKNEPEKGYVPIFTHSLDKRDVHRLVKAVKQNFPQISISLYSNQNWYVETLDKWSRSEADITGEEPIQKSFKQLIDDKETPIHKFLLIGETKDVQRLQQFCQEIDLEESAFYLSKENYLEVTHQAVSKELALIEVANYFQISLENTMAIGDNYNDIPMLLLAGLGVAMGNAPEKVKNSAKVETTTNNHNGASDAIKKYVIG
ncbi:MULTISPECIES: HAD family hydrolase [Enterococcus]|uniref:Cof-type HAD-IIB family hydrolase n=1 Tax=Candidatus Enterococcus ferrettii TaxID=2815324 RepID=A0ABV0EU20_9ENTE|nr:HAD family hydrolase [Enterococcus sp. 665A]MBO1339847.1 HAD family phosphatase [Enterococcus sp. 665A]